MTGLRVLPTVLLTEVLKLRRTLALRMTVLPLIVVLLYLLLGLFGASNLVPEFQSKPNRAHPLFAAFTAASAAVFTRSRTCSARCWRCCSPPRARRPRSTTPATPNPRCSPSNTRSPRCGEAGASSRTWCSATAWARSSPTTRYGSSRTCTARAAKSACS